jgi:hypothetical protein
MQARMRGRPRLPDDVRLKIVQKRARSPGSPPSIDVILRELDEEAGDDGYRPSRGSVQNVVHQWGKEVEAIRDRELPFQWHQLEKAGIPWEAGEWVGRCDAARIKGYIDLVGEGRVDIESLQSFSKFTNRLARWCWRVHLVAPDLPPIIALEMARAYDQAEMAHDLLPSHPPMQTDVFDGWLSLVGVGPKHDEYKERKALYIKAVEAQLVPRMTVSAGFQEVQQTSDLTGLTTTTGGLWPLQQTGALINRLQLIGEISKEEADEWRNALMGRETTQEESDGKATRK